MDTTATPELRQLLDKDLQIVSATLATIDADVRRFSIPAAEAIEQALRRLAEARAAFQPAPPAGAS